MKKIISNQELQEKMAEAINLLCNTVKTTLGPKGNNCIIDHSDFTPFITNDGATIAKNIESDDVVINTILELAKEASLKTNELVGDGTTTTLVLLQSIFNFSLEYINNGLNPLILKKELNNSLKELLNILESIKIKPTKNQLKQVATISANDEEIGAIVFEVFNKVKSKKAITIEEVDEIALNARFMKGYEIPIIPASDYYFKDKATINISNSYLLIINDLVYDLELFSFIINELLNTKQDLIIIAEDYDHNFIKEIINLNLEEDFNIYLFKFANYGLKQRLVENDLEILTNTQVIEKNSHITFKILGLISNAFISSEKIRIDFSINQSIKNYLAKIKAELPQTIDDFDLDFYQKRIASFENGTAIINIGAPTKTERREKKMRLEDAICALDSAQVGILPGGGVTFLKLSSELKKHNEATLILKKALLAPFKQIIINAGLDAQKIQRAIEENNYTLIYNIYTDTYEQFDKSSVIDSYQVIKTSLINAVSIATMLLTTSSLIINEYDNSLKKLNDFNDI